MVKNHLSIKHYLPAIALVSLAVSGTLCVYSVMSYLDIQFSFSLGFVCMSIILGVYLFNRFTDLVEDFSNNANRGIFVIYKNLLLPLSILLLVSGFLTLTFLHKMTVYHMLLLAVGIIYSFPLIPWFSKNNGLIFYRLKQLPFIKNIFVAALWGFSIFIIPILFVNTKISNLFPISMLICSQIIATLSCTLFSDIRDTSGDRYAGNLTIPVLLGEAFSIKIIYLMNSAWLLLLIFLTANGSLDIWHFIFMSVILMYIPSCILLYKYNLLSNTTIDIIGDLDLLLFAFGIKLLSYL